MHRYNGKPFWQRIAVLLSAILLPAALLVVSVLWLYHHRGELLVVLTPFIASLLLAYLLSPVVDLMVRRRISRALAIVVIYLVFAIIVFVFCVRIVPSLLEDLMALTERLPDYAGNLQDFLHHLEEDYRRFDLPENLRDLIDQNIENVQETLSRRLTGVYDFILSSFSRVLLLLLVPILTFYFLRDEEQLRHWLVGVVPSSYRRRFTALLNDINLALGAYFRGALLVSGGVAVLSYIGYLVIGLEFSLVLAAIAGVTNLIPFFGPLIGAVPALLVALLNSPLTALKVLIVVVAVQQVEAQLLTPLVIGRSTGLHPLLIIFALLVAGKFLGFIGLLIALPGTIVLRIVYNHLREIFSR